MNIGVGSCSEENMAGNGPFKGEVVWGGTRERSPVGGSREGATIIDGGGWDFGLGGGKGPVCVTGGTGYVGSSLIKRFLELGYTVRATVRNPEDKKTAFLRRMEGAECRLNVVPADLLQEGSFDAATEGVVGVFHTAGQVMPPHPGSDPQVARIDPFVKGTLNVLKSCAKSSTVKKVVLTSSCSAIRYDYNRTTDGPALDDLCWSNVEYCTQHQMWYALAKTQAEREAWLFARVHDLNLVVVNPSYILGPFLGDCPTSTMAYMLHLFQGKIDEYPNQIVGFVHIDDVVEAHVLVYERMEAHGRYICSSFVSHWRDVLSTIRSKYPTLQLPAKCIEDDAEAIPHAMNANKIRQLGLRPFKGAEKMLEDCVQSCVRKGLLPAPR